MHALGSKEQLVLICAEEHEVSHQGLYQGDWAINTHRKQFDLQVYSVDFKVHTSDKNSMR